MQVIGCIRCRPMVAIGSKLFSYMSGQIVYIDYGCASVEEMNLLVD